MGVDKPVAAVSFKSKYIAVAVTAAIALALAVGFVLVVENRMQHAALLDSTATDARARVARDVQEAWRPRLLALRARTPDPGERRRVGAALRDLAVAGTRP